MDLCIKKLLNSYESNNNVEDLNKALNIMTTHSNQFSQNFSHNPFNEELFVSLAELALENNEKIITKIILTSYLPIAITQSYYGRALLCQALISGPENTDEIDKLEKAQEYLFEALEIGTKYPECSFLIFNISITFWKISEIFMKQDYRFLIMNGLQKIFKALNKNKDKDYIWITRIIIELLKSYCEVNKKNFAINLVTNSFNMIRSHASSYFKEFFRLAIVKNLFEIGKLDKEIKMTTEINFYQRICRLKCSLDNNGLRADNYDEIKKIFETIFSNASKKALVKNKDINSDMHLSILLIEFAHMMYKYDLLRAVERLINHFRKNYHCFNAYSQSLVQCLDIELKIRMKSQPISTTRRFSSVDIKIGKITPLNSNSSQSYLPHNISLIETPVYNSSNTFGIINDESIKLRHESCENLINIINNNLRNQHIDIVQVACVAIWNMCLPLLHYNLKNDIVKYIKFASDSLEKIESNMNEMRSRLYMELGKFYKKDQKPILALQNINKAMIKDEKCLYQNSLFYLKYRIEKSMQLYEKPVDILDKVTQLIEQLLSAENLTKDDKNSDYDKNNNSDKNTNELLIQVGGLLAPTFRFVLAAENIKPLDINDTISLLAASQRMDSLEDINEKIREFEIISNGATEFLLRCQLCIDLCFLAWKKNQFDIFRTAVRFTLTFASEKLYSIEKTNDKDKNDSINSNTYTRDLSHMNCSEKLYSANTRDVTASEMVPPYEYEDDERLSNSSDSKISYNLPDLNMEGLIIVRNNTFRKLAQLHIMYAEANIVSLKRDKVNINCIPTLETYTNLDRNVIDENVGHFRQNTKKKTLLFDNYTVWIQHISTLTLDNFIQSAEIGKRLNINSIIYKAANYFYNYCKHLIANQKQECIRIYLQKLYTYMIDADIVESYDTLFTITIEYAYSILYCWIENKKSKSTEKMICLQNQGLVDWKDGPTVRAIMNLEDNIFQNWNNDDWMIQLEIYIRNFELCHALVNKQNEKMLTPPITTFRKSSNNSFVGAGDGLCAYWLKRMLPIEKKLILIKDDISKIKKDYSMSNVPQSEYSINESENGKYYKYIRCYELYIHMILLDLVYSNQYTILSDEKGFILCERLIYACSLADEFKLYNLLFQTRKYYMLVMLPIIVNIKANRTKLCQSLTNLFQYVPFFDKKEKYITSPTLENLIRDNITCINNKNYFNIMEHPIDSTASNNLAIHTFLIITLFNCHVLSKNYSIAITFMEKQISGIPKSSYKLLMIKKLILLKAQLQQPVNLLFQKFKNEPQDFLSYMWFRISIISNHSKTQYAMLLSSISCITDEKLVHKKVEAIINLVDWIMVNTFNQTEIEFLCKWMMHLILSHKREPQEIIVIPTVVSQPNNKKSKKNEKDKDKDKDKDKAKEKAKLNKPNERIIQLNKTIHALSSKKSPISIIKSNHNQETIDSEIDEYNISKINNVQDLMLLLEIISTYQSKTLSRDLKNLANWNYATPIKLWNSIKLGSTQINYLINDAPLHIRLNIHLYSNLLKIYNMSNIIENQLKEAFLNPVTHYSLFSIFAQTIFQNQDLYNYYNLKIFQNFHTLNIGYNQNEYLEIIKKNFLNKTKILKAEKNLRDWTFTNLLKENEIKINIKSVNYEAKSLFTEYHVWSKSGQALLKEGLFYEAQILFTQCYKLAVGYNDEKYCSISLVLMAKHSSAEKQYGRVIRYFNRSNLNYRGDELHWLKVRIGLAKAYKNENNLTDNYNKCIESLYTTNHYINEKIETLLENSSKKYIDLRLKKLRFCLTMVQYNVYISSLESCNLASDISFAYISETNPSDSSLYRRTFGLVCVENLAKILSEFEKGGYIKKFVKYLHHLNVFISNFIHNNEIDKKNEQLNKKLFFSDYDLHSIYKILMPLNITCIRYISKILTNCLCLTDYSLNYFINYKYINNESKLLIMYSQFMKHYITFKSQVDQVNLTEIKLSSNIKNDYKVKDKPLINANAFIVDEYRHSINKRGSEEWLEKAYNHEYDESSASTLTMLNNLNCDKISTNYIIMSNLLLKHVQTTFSEFMDSDWRYKSKITINGSNNLQLNSPKEDVNKNKKVENIIQDSPNEVPPLSISQKSRYRKVIVGKKHQYLQFLSRISQISDVLMECLIYFIEINKFLIVMELCQRLMNITNQYDCETSCKLLSVFQSAKNCHFIRNNVFQRIFNDSSISRFSSLVCSMEYISNPNNITETHRMAPVKYQILTDLKQSCTAWNRSSLNNNLFTFGKELNSNFKFVIVTSSLIDNFLYICHYIPYQKTNVTNSSNAKNTVNTNTAPNLNLSEKYIQEISQNENFIFKIDLAQCQYTHETERKHIINSDYSSSINEIKQNYFSFLQIKDQSFSFADSLDKMFTNNEFLKDTYSEKLNTINHIQLNSHENVDVASEEITFYERCINNLENVLNDYQNLQKLTINFLQSALEDNVTFNKTPTSKGGEITYNVILIDPQFANLHLEIIFSLINNNSLAISRDYSYQLFIYRFLSQNEEIEITNRPYLPSIISDIKEVKKTNKSMMDKSGNNINVDINNVRYLVDPHHENDQSCDDFSNHMNESHICNFSAKWLGILGKEKIISNACWESYISSGSIFFTSTPCRMFSYYRPHYFLSIRVQETQVAIISERCQNTAAYLNKSHDNEIILPNIKCLETPENTALFCSLIGINCVLYNQFSFESSKNIEQIFELLKQMMTCNNSIGHVMSRYINSGIQNVNENKIDVNEKNNNDKTNSKNDIDSNLEVEENGSTSIKKKTQEIKEKYYNLLNSIKHVINVGLPNIHIG
ncbi:hypothetical protein A3Q56_00737 [Intoshia linei]|uniref:Uncharacterized protein n=1 Tax=Intoshia linei TaxID=1819745 RepID=A0A177BBB9_9BILA|nr:hypothetical protein A3Q56_00737 [Intoshia linei]